VTLKIIEKQSTVSSSDSEKLDADMLTNAKVGGASHNLTKPDIDRWMHAVPLATLLNFKQVAVQISTTKSPPAITPEGFTYLIKSVSRLHHSSGRFAS
jgi:hypothetical protein